VSIGFSIGVVDDIQRTGCALHLKKYTTYHLARTCFILKKKNIF
jgi:hypothetical protein